MSETEKRPKGKSFRCELSEHNTVILSTRDSVIIAMYISPLKSIDTFKERLPTIATCTDNAKTVLLCGDPDAPLGEPNSRRSPILENFSGSWSLSAHSYPELLTVISTQGRSIIDLFASNSDASSQGYQEELPVFGLTQLLPVGVRLPAYSSESRPKDKGLNCKID